MPVHVVNVQLVNVDASGSVLVNKTGTIAQVMTSDTDRRIAFNPNVDNSADWPTIEAYLMAEDDDGFKLVHMDQYIIVTQT
jgi:hypothetical protein